MDLASLSKRLDASPWARLQWRLRKGEKPTRAEILAVIAAHPDFGPPVADLLRKAPGKTGRVGRRPRPAEDKWWLYVWRVAVVSLEERELRARGRAAYAPHKPLDKAIANVAEWSGIGETSLADDVRRVPPGAPQWVREARQRYRTMRGAEKG